MKLVSRYELKRFYDHQEYACSLSYRVSHASITVALVVAISACDESCWSAWGSTIEVLLCGSPFSNQVKYVLVQEDLVTLSA